jgi:hypothetical protein
MVAVKMIVAVDESGPDVGLATIEDDVEPALRRAQAIAVAGEGHVAGVDPHAHGVRPAGT